MKNSLLILLLSTKIFSSQFDLYFSQASSEDWRNGNVTFFEGGGAILVNESFKIDTLDITYNLRLKAAYRFQNNSANQFIVPSENEIFSELIIKYPMGWVLDPYVSTGLISQPLVSFQISNNNLIKTASWRDPVTTNQSLGFAYTYRKLKNMFTSRFGLSYRQIRARDHIQLTDNRSTPELQENYKEETGIQINIDANIVLDSSVSYRNNSLFQSEFENLEVWNLRVENEFQIKLWQIFVAIIKIDIYYDERQMMAVQYNQCFRFGISATIF